MRKFVIRTLIGAATFSNFLGCASGKVVSVNANIDRRIAQTTSAPQSPQTPTILYYYAYARMTFVASGYGPPAGTVVPEEVLLVKTLDPQNSMLSEIACLRDTGRPSYLSPIYMKVTGNKLQIADTADVTHPNKVTGVGAVSGPAWNWNYLKFSMNYLPYSAPVEDVNVVTPTQLIGRKQLFSSDGTLFELYDLEMDQITEDQYQAHFTSMGCPTQN